MPAPLFLRGGSAVSLGLGGGSDPGDPGGGGDVISPDVVRLVWENTVSKKHTISAYQDGVKCADVVSGKRYPAGINSVDWVAVDADGNAIANGAVVDFDHLHHNIDFTATRLANMAVYTGEGQFEQFYIPSEMWLDGGDDFLFASPGYSETDLYCWRLDLTVPDQWIRYVRGGTPWIPLMGTSDGTYVYQVLRKGTASGAPFDNILIKWDIATGTLQLWSGLTPSAYDLANGNGPAGDNYGGYALPLGTDSASTTAEYRPRRISCQVSGNAIAIAQPGQGKILVFHKGTGAVGNTLSQTGSAICWDHTEQKLWVGNDNALQYWARADWTTVGATSTIGPISHGYTGTIVDIRCDYGNSLIGVVFGGDGADMVVAPLSDSDGSSAGTDLGQSGGYASTTTVADDRFHFGKLFETRVTNHPGNISFYSDGSLLVYEPALGRAQKVTDPFGTPSFEVVFECVGPYGFAVDINDPTMLIAPHLVGWTRTYSTEPTEGQAGGNGAYSLDKFWGYDYYDTHYASANGDIYWAFSSGGHLFAYVLFQLVSDNSNHRYLVELTSTGVREITALSTSSDYNVYFQPSTNDRYKYVTASRTITKEAFGGLDGSNNPTWGSASTHVVLPNAQPLPVTALCKGGWAVLTDGSVIVLGSQAPGTEGTPHLMRIDSSANVLWKHVFELDASIPFPTDGHGTTGGSNAPVALAVNEDEDYIALSWSGEGWANGQSCAFLIFNLNGQLVEKIGDSSLSATGPFSQDTPAIMEQGNVASMSLVVGNSIKRLLYNGENHASGITEVRFDHEATYAVTSLSATVGGQGNFGTLAGDSYAPDNIGDVNVSDAFSSNSIGTTWTDPSSAFEITGGVLRAKTGEAYNDYTNFLHIADTVAGDCLRITIPPPLNGQGHVSGGDVRANWALAGRYNPATGLCIGAMLEFLGTGDVNGAFRAHLFTRDANAVYRSILMDRAEDLPVSPGHSYSFEFGYAGAAPTRMFMRLWDEDDGVVIFERQTVTNVAAYGGTGYNAIMLTRLSEVTLYQSNILSWSKAKIPYRST